MLMEALRPWINYDFEGVVHPGQRFEAHTNRARDLELAGLAVPCLDENEQIKVVADEPALPPAKAPAPPPTAKPHATQKPKGRR
jgi:hypothetical protein